MKHSFLNEKGNILFYILLGIVLLGALTVVLRNTDNGMKDIDKEDYILKATKVQRYGAELSTAVAKLLNEGGLSESDIRFAFPSAGNEYGTITVDPTHQVFSASGGKVVYQEVPEGVNDGSQWEFFATTQIPQVGSDKAELVAVLPNVSQEFCTIINSQLGFTTGTQPTDNATGTTPDCVNGAAAQRFAGSFSDTTPNVMDDATFSRLPSLQACVECRSDSTYNYFYVLLAR